MLESPYFCDSFNRRRFFILSLLFMFITLLALRLDNFIYWPYWIVFFPLWLWQSVMFGGFFFETFTFCRNPRYYVESQLQLKQLFLEAFFHIDLLFFEVLACNRLDHAHSSWMSVYIPLVILCVIGVFMCILAIMNDYDCDLQILVSGNVAFFIFIALKLDNIVNWSWITVFIPFFIFITILFLVEILEFFISIMTFVSANILANRRQQSFCITTGYLVGLLPIITFGILLSFKLDGELDLPYVILTSPLLFAIIVFMSLCFSLRPHFQWRRCIQATCRMIFGLCLPLQEYGNISYKLSSLHTTSRVSQRRNSHSDTTINSFHPTQRALAPLDLSHLPLASVSRANVASFYGTGGGEGEINDNEKAAFHLTRTSESLSSEAQQVFVICPSPTLRLNLPD